jgi:hypothetical protein
MRKQEKAVELPEEIPEPSENDNSQNAAEDQPEDKQFLIKF